MGTARRPGALLSSGALRLTTPRTLASGDTLINCVGVALSMSGLQTGWLSFVAGLLNRVLPAVPVELVGAIFSESGEVLAYRTC